VDPHDPDGSTHDVTPDPGAQGHSWTPPDAGDPPAPATDPGRVDVEVGDADGPPVPPPVRRRRRRRRALLTGAVLVVVGVPVGLGVATMLEADDTPSAIGGDGSPAETEDRDDDASDDDANGGTGGDDTLEPPDLDGLAGTDAVYGQLLVDIDASEQVMMAFQDEVATVFSVPAESPDELVQALQEIGTEGRDELLEVRDRFDDELDVDGAEVVRDRYLAHLDSWAEYMDAVSEDPSVLGGEGTGDGFTVVINATADAFARALEDELPEDADASVRAYADDILDRGFRGSSDAQV
jgi:hypothetical protein